MPRVQPRHAAPRPTAGPRVIRLGRPARRRAGVLAALVVLLAAAVALGNPAGAVAKTYSLWSATTVPVSPSDSQVASVELGTVFSSSVTGRVTAIRFYKSAKNLGTHTGSLWDAKGRRLATVTFTGETASGWQRAKLPSSVALIAGARYVVSYTSSGHYAGDNDYFAGGKVQTSGPLRATAGVFRYGAGFPTEQWRNTNYYVDLEFVTDKFVDAGANPTRPTRPTKSTTKAPITSTVATTASGTTTSATTSATTSVSSSSTTSRTTTASTTTKSATTTSATTSSTTTKSTTASGATSSSTTPPPTGSGATCAITPSACGYPDSSTAGTRTALTAAKRVPQDVTSGPGWRYESAGYVSIYGSGVTFSGFRVTTNIDVTGQNVTIRDNEIVASGYYPISLRHTTGTIIDHNSIHGVSSTSTCDNAIRDIYGDSDAVTITNNDIYWCNSGVNHFDLGGLIAGNYIHDLGYDCPSGSTTCDHFNGIQLEAGHGPLMTIENNTILVPYGQTDAIMLANSDGSQTNRKITRNLIGGGGYTFYGSGGLAGVATNITFTDNAFTTRYFPNGGYWGPVAHWKSGNGNVWSGNRWIDGPNQGNAVNP